MRSEMNRREFLKRAGLLGLSATASGLLAACAPHVSPTVAAVQTQAAEAAATAEAAAARAPAVEEKPVEEKPKVLSCDGRVLGDSGLKAAIEVWSWAAEALSVVMPTFKELYPGVEVKFSNMPWGEVHDKASIAMAAGVGFPDVFSIDGTQLQKIIRAGGLLDMTPVIEACKEDFPAYKIAEATDPRDGKLYAIPWDMGPVGLYYRKDLWEEKNFQVPTTWDQYIEQGIEFAKDGHYMIEMPKGGTAFHFDILLQQLGGSYFAPDGSVTVDSNLGVKAMDMVKRMYDAGITTDIAQWSPGWFTGWKEGTLITNWGAAWMGHVFPDNIKEGEPTFGQWRIAPLPAFQAGGARSSNHGGSNLAIPAQTKNRDAALAFAVYAVASLEGQVVGTLAGNISSYLPALRDPRVVNATNPIYGDQRYFALFADLSEEVPTNFIRAAPYMESQPVIADVTAKVLSGDLTVETAVKQAGERIREIAAKYS
jgi:ABC-type glycerol-3-phosphate transport system substrate-binding protein